MHDTEHVLKFLTPIYPFSTRSSNDPKHFQYKVKQRPQTLAQTLAYKPSVGTDNELEESIANAYLHNDWSVHYTLFRQIRV
jgi:hypothetical protein